MATVFNPLTSLASGAVSGHVCGSSKYAGPASYAAGGFAVDIKADEGLNNDPHFVSVSAAGDTNGTPAETTNVLDYIAEYDYANKKVIVYDPADGSEVADTTDLSGAFFRLGWMSSQA